MDWNLVVKRVSKNLAEIFTMLLICFGLCQIIGSLLISSRASTVDNYVNLELLFSRIQWTIIGGTFFIGGLIIRMTMFLKRS